MTKRIFISLSTAIFVSVISLPCSGQVLSNQECHLYVSVEPDRSRITGKAEIKYPAGLSFLLTKSLNIGKIYSDGREVPFIRNSFSPFDNLYSISPGAGLPNNITIEYSGKIIFDSFPKTVSSINLIKSGLVELSDQIIWYPRMLKCPFCLYKLNINVPSGYVTVTNMNLLDRKPGKLQTLTIWDSSEPCYGISVIAAPGFKKSSINKDGKSVEIYFSRLPLTYVDSMKNYLLNAIIKLSELYGSSGSQNLVRVVYSPRVAGGYARSPLVLVSEYYAIEQRGFDFGQARDFRLNAHEISHYWSLADSNSPDDWINEGLAEYSALLISEEIIGVKFSDMLLKEYNEIVASTPGINSILNTKADSPDRELNRYYKPAILLNDFRVRFGDAKMREFIKSLYACFLKSGKATTALFLEVLNDKFGSVERDSFSLALTRKEWRKGGGRVIVKTHIDTVYTGTWAGPLTQAGSTVKFVLNLKLTNGTLDPYLDSPDQNVTGIPISDLLIVNDSISFRISVASASYRGRLDRRKMIIEGEFLQRGGTYLLNLTKE